MPEPIKPPPPPPCRTEETKCGKADKKMRFSGLAKDDVIIVAVLFMLLADDCNDKLLLLILIGLLLFDTI